MTNNSFKELVRELDERLIDHNESQKSKLLETITSSSGITATEITSKITVHSLSDLPVKITYPATLSGSPVKIEYPSVGGRVKIKKVKPKKVVIKTSKLLSSLLKKV